LEAAFRSGSLLDMGKEADLYRAYLKLTRVLSSHETLVPCLINLDYRYVPIQVASVQQLLTKIKDLALIFTKVSSKANVSTDEKAQSILAEDIISTKTIVD
jgi:hypothetical protein